MQMCIRDSMKAAMARAMDEGADPELVEKMGYGKTAIVATMKSVSYTHLKPNCRVKLNNKKIHSEFSIMH